MFAPGSSPTRRRAVAFATAVLVLLIGVWFGGHPSWLPGPLRSVFVSKTADERLVQTTLDLIAKDYYRPVNTNTLLNDGLQQAVASLNDPYSHYYPPSLYRSFQSDTNSQISGIGVAVAPESVRRGVEIEEVYAATPAAKAGLRRGDVITAVNGTPLAGKSLTQASALIQGTVGSTVRLSLLRGATAIDVKVTRENITIPVVAGKLVRYRGKAIGYLALSQFAQNAAQELRGEVQRMLKQHAQGLVLDLRDNPGGLLLEAVGVASLFIPDGTIVTTRGRSQPTTVYTALGDAIAPKIPLVVLVDRGTASSAEIVTGALKDRGRAKVVGTNTYGKGVFQEIQPVPGGGALDITVGEYFTPDGHNLGAGGVKEGKGIAPNVYVYDNPDAPGAHALQVAEQTVAAEIKGSAIAR